MRYLHWKLSFLVTLVVLVIKFSRKSKVRDLDGVLSLNIGNKDVSCSKISLDKVGERFQQTSALTCELSHLMPSSSCRRLFVLLCIEFSLQIGPVKAYM